MIVPPSDTVQVHRDALRDLDQRQHDCVSVSAPRSKNRPGTRRHISESQIPKMLLDQKTFPERANIGTPVGPWSVAVTWRPIQFQRKTSALSPRRIMTLLAAYEAAVSEADTLADKRFDKAEAAARLAVLSRQIAEQEELLEGIRQEEILLDQEKEAMDAAWREMWREVPVAPLPPPDAMLLWVASRQEVLAGIERRLVAQRLVTTLRSDETAAKAPLLGQLQTLNVDIELLKDEPLRVVLETCAGILRHHDKEAEARRHLEEGLRKATGDAERKRKALDKAKQALSAWQNRWTDALSHLGLGAGAAPEGVAAQVNAIDEMREVAVKVNELRHERIGKIERDITAFDNDVSDIVAAVATDLADVQPEEAVLQLESRLDAARRLRDLQKEKDEDIETLEEKIKECNESLRDAREIIAHLQQTAGVETIERLKAAIQKSDTLRRLKAELLNVTESLVKEGDGLSVSRTARRVCRRRY